jgi:hypothetical protein
MWDQGKIDVVFILIRSMIYNLLNFNMCRNGIMVLKPYGKSRKRKAVSIRNEKKTEGVVWSAADRVRLNEELLVA